MGRFGFNPGALGLVPSEGKGVQYGTSFSCDGSGCGKNCPIKAIRNDVIQSCCTEHVTPVPSVSKSNTSSTEELTDGFLVNV